MNNAFASNDSTIHNVMNYISRRDKEKSSGLGSETIIMQNESVIANNAYIVSYRIVKFAVLQHTDGTNFYDRFKRDLLRALRLVVYQRTLHY